jgi:hypothetical protein
VSLLLAAAHGAESQSFWSEYVHLVTDTAHIAFEATYEIISGILIYPLAKKVWDRLGSRTVIEQHDREHHPDDVHEA